MRVRDRLPLAALLAVLLVIPAAAAAAVSNATDGPSVGATVDTGSAIVQLQLDPLSTAAPSRPPKGKKIDFDSATVKSYRALLSAQRNDFKQWLRANAPNAKVTGEFDISLNAVAVKLNGETLGTVASAPQVRTAQYEGLYYPIALGDPDLDLIRASEAWAAAGGGPADAGAGVKVAILDTGIDITHPCFSDAGYAPQTQLGDRTFTNNKVIVAKVFNNKTPSRGYTAEAIQEHGTHVSGTVACNFGTAATVDGVAIPHPISGVAPRALLGNYNIFPGDDGNARSEDILNALEAAYADGFDVVNMSLGGGAQGFQDLLTIAVDDLDQAGMVSAVAAGNSGPGLFTVESPGSAARALTAGAATVGHFIAAPITTVDGSFPGVAGAFGTVSSDLTAPLAVIPGPGANGLSLACSALTADLSGKIAMVARGSCTFSTKIRNAQAAGAIAAIVSNNVAGDGIAMGQDGTANQPTIPAYMVSLSDGGGVKLADGTAVTIGAGQAYFVTGNDDFMASFSSQGPTDVDFRVKPDVVAPGVNVLSSIPHQFCATPPCFAFFQGTSMATPHLAGSAAVVEWAHPTWTSAQVRSAIVNTADVGTLKKYTGTALETKVNVIGAGRENLLSAVGAKVALDPVSVSFGAVPSGSGQTRTFDVQVSDLTGAGGTYAVSVGAGGGGVAYSVSPSTLSLGANGTATVTVTMSADKGAAPGGHQARLTIAGAAHAAVYTLVK
ncbi:MAG TPA: S8 family serine peptidase [Anaeromyxobacter sp.]